MAGFKSACAGETLAAAMRTAFVGGLLIALTAATGAAEPSIVPAPAAATALPDVGSSIIRLFGALALVLALFFGGIYLFRNWQRLSIRRGNAPLLNVIEVKSLGHRHALFVVGYETQRLLLASSPNGVSLLCHLPESEETDASDVQTASVSFTDAFQQALGRQP